MPVDSKHPAYLEMESEWLKAKAFAHSEKKVKSGGELYVPRLSEQTDAEYAAYLSRASLSMLFKKTINTYTGLVTKTPAYIDPLEPVEEYLKTCSGDGGAFGSFLLKMLKRYFTFGRCGTLIDLPAGRTGAEPSLFAYDALSMINWDSTIIDGKEALTMMVLMEWEKVDVTSDVFDTNQQLRYRVLTLEDGVYHHRVFDKNLKLVVDIVPERDNKPLDRIPFVVHGGIAPNPVFIGEVLDLNLHHFQLSADQFHGLHFCGLPTPWVSGVGKDDAPKFVGPTRFAVLEDPEAKIGLMEFQGQGMQPIADKLHTIEGTVAALSASVMERSGRVTATQSNIDFANDTASLVGTVHLLSEEISRALSFATTWISKPAVEVKLTTDFVSGKLSAQELLALTQAYLSGSISYATYWSNLIQGEIADPHKTAETEQSEIEIDPNPPEAMDNGTDDSTTI